MSFLKLSIYFILVLIMCTRVDAIAFTGTHYTDAVDHTTLCSPEDSGQTKQKRFIFKGGGGKWFPLDNQTQFTSSSFFCLAPGFRVSSWEVFMYSSIYPMNMDTFTLRNDIFVCRRQSSLCLQIERKIIVGKKFWLESGLGCGFREMRGMQEYSSSGGQLSNRSFFFPSADAETALYWNGPVLLGIEAHLNYYYVSNTYSSSVNQLALSVGLFLRFYK